MAFSCENWNWTSCSPIFELYSLNYKYCLTLPVGVLWYICTQKTVHHRKLSKLSVQKLLIKSCWNWHLGSISPTFFKLLFRTKVVCAAFLYLQFAFVIILAKGNRHKSCSYNIGEIDTRTGGPGVPSYASLAYYLVVSTMWWLICKLYMTKQFQLPCLSNFFVHLKSLL